eukprot:3633679-Amphidinium_carterae.1
MLPAYELGTLKVVTKLYAKILAHALYAVRAHTSTSVTVWKLNSSTKGQSLSVEHYRRTVTIYIMHFAHTVQVAKKVEQKHCIQDP